MGWFKYIYEIDWQEESAPYVAPVDTDNLLVSGVETDVSSQSWRKWIESWRTSATDNRKDIFTKRNARYLYFVDGRKKIYSKVLLKGGIVGVFVEILAGTVEWSLQRGIQVLLIPSVHRGVEDILLF